MPRSGDSDYDHRSVYSVGSRADKKDDSIPFRVDFARAVVYDCNLNSMLYTDTNDTEAYMYPVETDDKTDTRKVLSKKLRNFHDVIKDIGGKLKYIKSGTTGHTFKGIRTEKDTTIEYGLKVVAFPKKEKYGDRHDVSRPENAELMIIKLLSGFVVRKETPHVVLPLGSFDCSIKPFVSLIEDNIVNNDNKKYNEFVERYKKGEYHDHVSVLISEWANRGDLLEFMRRSFKNFQLIHWQTFFFQIISVLAVIQSKYPAFRHNDLKANNILVHKIDKTLKSFFYTVNKKRYEIPNIGYRIKIWDFDFACVDGIVNNSKVDAEWTSQINISGKQNRYYDMHYFFNTLIKKGFLPEFMTSSKVPQEAKDFVNRVVPPRYQTGENVAKKGRILLETEHTTPDKVLRSDPFFDVFRT